MLSPIVIPLPLAMTALLLLSVAAQRLLAPAEPHWPIGPPTPARVARHRLADATQPYRPGARRWTPDELDTALDQAEAERIIAEMAAAELRWAAPAEPVAA